MDCVNGNRTVFLLRHGAVSSNHGRTYIGQVEKPLSEEGIRQALRLRVLLEHASIAAVFASDLERSRMTAEIVTEGRELEVRFRRELREIGLGDWEGRSFAEIAGRYPDEFRARGEDLERWRPPGGESFGDLRDRVLPCFRELLASFEGNLLIAGHAGVNRVILCEAMGMPLANLFRIGQDYGCLNAIECRDSGLRIQLMNYTPWSVTAGLETDQVREFAVAK